MNGRNVTLAEIKYFYGARHKNFHGDRSMLSAEKCRLMIPVAGNTKYMRIFARHLVTFVITFQMSSDFSSSWQKHTSGNLKQTQMYIAHHNSVISVPTYVVKTSNDFTASHEITSLSMKRGVSYI